MTNKDIKLSGNRCQCPTCLEFFNSESVFDRHRVGSYEDRLKPRRCLTIPEMQAKGLVKSDRGYWLRCRREAGTIRREGPLPSLLDSR